MGESFSELESNSIQKLTEINKSHQLSLNERLEKIKLTDGEKLEIKSRKGFNSAVDLICDSFPPAKFIKAIIDWNEESNNEIREIQKEMLLESFFKKADDNDVSLKKLMDFLTNPQGRVLTNKIIEITSDHPPDLDLINHLSNLLIHISKTDYVSLFNKHKFYINLLDKLSPASLNILLDNENWPKLKGIRFHVSSEIITSPWTNKFAELYIEKKFPFHDTKELLEIVDYSVLNLLSNNLVIGKSDGENGARAEITDLGNELINYIK